jgi:hypothetical protein
MMGMEMTNRVGIRAPQLALLFASVLALAACGGDAPAPPAPIPPAVVAEEVEEVVDPNAVQPDASIEAVVVDANATTTVAGEEGLVPTPEKPVIEVVAYEDLAFVVGERVIIRTNIGSTREGILKRFFNTGLKVLVNERGREIELDMPRTTVSEVKVVWTRAQGAVAPVPASEPTP